jgi:hypothetical protein
MPWGRFATENFKQDRPLKRNTSKSTRAKKSEIEVSPAFAILKTADGRADNADFDSI